MANNGYLVSKYMQDSILQRVTSTGVAPSSLVANVSRSGQLGTGIRYTKLDGATPAVFNPVVCVVLQVPRMWDRWPKMQETLRALMETHAKSITGIDFGYTLATDETPVGHDGQTLKVPTRTSRGGVTPSAVFQEYPGMPVYNLFRQWMFDIQHPDTNSSLLPSNMLDSTQSQSDGTGTTNYKDMPAWYMSAYSMSCLFIQYDPSGLPDRIYDAYIIANMFPTGMGDIGFERTINQTTIKERTIEFTGLVQHNENTRELGFRVAEMLALHKINYNFALPGLAGVTNLGADSQVTAQAIDPMLRPLGGLEYEAGSCTTNGYGGEIGGSISTFGRNTNVKGAIQQFKFLGEGGNNAYTELLNEQTDYYPETGAAEASVSQNYNTFTRSAESNTLYEDISQGLA